MDGKLCPGIQTPFPPLKFSPPLSGKAAFENDLIELVKNIKFRTVQNQLQRTLK